MSIKTLHITNAWHQTSGGVATFYRALMQAANRRSQQIRLIVPGEKDSVEDVGSGRIYTVVAPPARLNSAYRTIYPTQFLFKGSKLQKILADERPDLIEISDKYTLAYLGGLLRLRLLPAIDFRPVVVGLSNERMDDNFRSYLGWGQLGRRFCSWYMHWIYFPFFDHHIANSSYTAKELRMASQGHLVTRGIWVRHMGADLSQVSPANACVEGRQRLLALCGAAENSVLLLYVGRLAPEKNLQLLFELTAHLNRIGTRRFHLIVAGDGMERSRWEHYSAQHLPGHAVFLGHVRDRSMLAMLYANSDIFIHPNPREPFGIAPLEAMASGIPLLAPNQGGVTAYASPANSWTVPATVECFAAAIQEIVENRDLVAQKTRRALRTAAAHSWERSADRFLDLYDDMHHRFHGKTAAMPADFYSEPATAGTAKLAHWTSRLAQRLFSGISWLSESDRSSRELKESQPSSRKPVLDKCE